MVVMSMEAQCAQLRSLVHDCLAKHLYDSAIFFADKLVTLSKSASADVYLLAQTYFMGQQHRRCLALLRQSELVECDVRFRFLAAKCLAATREWEDCLTLLGGWELDDLQSMDLQELSRESVVGQEINFFAAIYLLRGKAYDALDNHSRALACYKAALKADPFCYEAFQLLVDKHMLTSTEEQEVLASMPFQEGHKWLALLYRCKCKKYDQQDTIEVDLETLERPSASPAESSSDTSDRRGSDIVMGERGVESEAAGSGLADNLDVLVCRAGWYHHLGLYQECYDLTSAIFEKDPYALECLPTHLSSALELNKKNDLFLRAHKLVEEYPTRAVSWFAVGCYYMTTHQYESARRYFGKATTLDAAFAPAWVGFGNAFAAQDESDQAMAAYRTAARRFPGLHAPLLGMGMEYQRMNNLALAEQMFLQAHRICPADPQACNELGVLHYRNRNMESAESWLRHALDLVPGHLTATWEQTVVNLGHVLRKQRRFEEAVQAYEQALGLSPGQPGTYAALGYTHHLKGNLAAAIENYHKALGLRPEDTFTAEMLTVALQEECATDDFEFLG